MAGKIYARILVDRVHIVTGDLIDNEHRGKESCIPFPSKISWHMHTHTYTDFQTFNLNKDVHSNIPLKDVTAFYVNVLSKVNSHILEKYRTGKES